MNLAALYGLIACAALLGCAAGLPAGPRRGRWIAVAVAALALLPALAGVSAAMWLHGAIGAPSPTLVLLAGRRLAAPGARLPGPAAGLILAVGALFYPAALGWGPFDPYGLGYRPLPLLLALVPLAALLAWRRRDGWLLVLGADLLAYAAGIFGNLWDALFDPVLVLAAGISLLRRPSRP